MRTLAICCIPALIVPLMAVAAPGGKQKKAPASYALIAGSVFREPGFSLPAAEVTVQLQDGASKANKFKKTKVLTDSRGEFAVRVPALPARYTVSVRAAGYRAQEKSVPVSGEERADVFFTLESASK